MTRSDDKSAAEAEHDVAEARADLEGSLDEIARRFDPDALLAEARSLFAGEGQSFRDVLIREARANPMAAIMAGVGAAWLLLGARRRMEDQRAYGVPRPPRGDIGPSAGGLDDPVIGTRDPGRGTDPLADPTTSAGSAAAAGTGRSATSSSTGGDVSSPTADAPMPPSGTDPAKR